MHSRETPGSPSQDRVTNRAIKSDAYAGRSSRQGLRSTSRYASDCDRGFPVKGVSLDAFDFLIVAFLNIRKFFGRHDGSAGSREPEFYTPPNDFICASSRGARRTCRAAGAGSSYEEVTN